MKTLVSGLALAAMTMTGSAFAANTPAVAPQTTTTAANAAPARLMDNVTLNFYSELYGPSVASVVGDSANPASKQVDANGTVGDPIFLDNTLRVGYKITPTVAARIGINFGYIPVLGQKLNAEDSYFQLINTKAIEAGNYSMAADIRFYGPTSKSAHNADRSTMIRLDQSSEYKVGNSRWTVGLATFERPFFYGSNAKPNSQQLELYAAPNLSYQATPSLAATLTYEMAAVHKAGKDVTDWDTEGTYLEPGVSWDITPAINFSPFLTFQSSRINPESTTVQFILSAKIL